MFVASLAGRLKNVCKQIIHLNQTKIMILTRGFQNKNRTKSFRAKTWIIMKLTIALLLFFTFQVSAKSDAQRITIVKSNIDLSQVFKDIEQQTGFHFFYDKDLIQKIKPIDITVINASLKQALAACLKGQQLTYAIVKNTIVIQQEEVMEPENFKSINVVDLPPPVQIHGRVTNQKGEPLSGVSVLVSGTKNGTTTSTDGRFTLSTADNKNIVLEISSVGYQTKTVKVGKQQTEINVTLEENAAGLSNVVVVGYGTQSRLSITGAVSTVNASELRTMPDANLGARLQGRISGVTVTGDASPGGIPIIRVRGYGSINNNDPLYVLDGVPLVGNLDNIDPNSIASISVLKDASSAAIYGSRASNGVVIITTKQGKSGPPKLSFNYRYGVQNYSKKFEDQLLTPMESAQLEWLSFTNSGFKVGDVGWGDAMYGYGATPVLPDYILPIGGMDGHVDTSLYSWPTPYVGIARANKTGTNWFDVISNKNAPTQEYNLSLSGGSDKGHYAFTAGYLNQQGAVLYTYYHRYSISLNSQSKIGNWLQVGENLSIGYGQRNGFGNENDLNPIAMAMRTSKLSPVYDIKGNFVTGYQPLAMLYRARNNSVKNLRLLGNSYAQVDFMKDFTFKSLFGVELDNSRAEAYALRMFESQDVAGADVLTEGYNGVLQYNWANTLNYNKTINDNHHFNLLLGSEVVKNRSDRINSSASTFPFTNTDYMILDAGQANQTAGGGWDSWFTFSYFARLNYSYKEKYLLEAVTRRDGSSRFNESNRWGTFPALSAGWRISQESFMRNVKWVDNLKLRVGIGKNGNDNVGNYNAYSTYRSNGFESYYNISGSTTNSTTPGFHEYSLGNPDARWESSATTDVGFDVGLFNKFDLSFDIYNRKTTDMLYPSSLPATWGQLVLPSVNVGEMMNKGIDAAVTYHDKIGKDFNFNVHGIFSHNKNEVIRLNGNPNEILYGPQLRQQSFTATKAGHPMSSFYGYVVEGIFNTQAEVDKWPKYNPSPSGVDSYSKPGVFKYKDVNGDGVINSLDRTFIGNPHPDFTYGLNIDLQYKNWNLSIFSQGSYGNKILNFRRWGLFSGISEKNDLYQSWTVDRFNNHDKITNPIVTNNNVELHQPSSYFVEDGSYFRVKSILVGYDLSHKMLSRLHINNLRFYLQFTNPFTITKYTGLDPELPNNDQLLGVDNSNYPTSYSTTFGIDLNF
jgi:TonB-dependent starch-binding outer membrane protein SusC